MKKVLLLTLVTMALVGLMAGTAVADEWWLANDGFVDELATLGAEKEAVFTGSGITWTADSDGAGYYIDQQVAGARSGLADRDNGWGTFAVSGMSASSPHGGYSITTDYCKLCHAVHDAGDDSYRLLKNGTTALVLAKGEGGVNAPNAADSMPNGMGSDRRNECMFCHNAMSGATGKRPYILGVVETVRGEHTIGATYIPDSIIVTDAAGILPNSATRALPDGRSSKLSNRDPANYTAGESPPLGCYDCHSVHGAKTIAAWHGDAVLRLDPANDGTDVTDNGRAGFADYTDAGTFPANAGSGDPTTTVTGGDMLRNNFCADCHNKNASWDADDSRPNAVGGQSHVTGPSADGFSEVYGTTETVAWSKEKGVMDRGCRGCHNSSDHGSNVFDDGDGDSPDHLNEILSAWPHQSMESKFLKNGTEVDTATVGAHEGYDGEAVPGTDTSGDIGDAYRALNQLDGICLQCHMEDSGNINGSTWGVGINF